jgi:peptide/nickel transport system permease protein
MTAGAATTVSQKPMRKKAVSQSYWSLVWWKFRKNTLAIIGAVLIILLYGGMVVLTEFVAPYTKEQNTDFVEAPPQLMHFVDSEGQFHLRPFVYGFEKKVDMVARTRTWAPNPEKIFPIYFFTPGAPYKLFGLIPTNIHLFGVDYSDPDASIFLFGTDSQGRDYLSLIVYGGRLSLMIGLIGQFLTLIFGTVLGVASGYYGGTIDVLVQRTTEFLSAFPDIPLFMALAAAIPGWWSPIAVYFMLTVILAFVRWGGLARQVRGLTLSLREREYALAAKSAGAEDSRIMFAHLLPGTMSHVIVIATLSIPSMILAETALSWLGLGLRPPLISWGVLLNEASTVRAIQITPWLLLVVPFILLTILAYNMLGDGLRDAMDPYGAR